MKQITIRNVSPKLGKALKSEQQRRGSSLNQTVIDILESSLGINSNGPFDNGLNKFAGTWDEEEFKEFEQNTRKFEMIDKEIWE